MLIAPWMSDLCQEGWRRPWRLPQLHKASLPIQNPKANGKCIASSLVQSQVTWHRETGPIQYLVSSSSHNSLTSRFFQACPYREHSWWESLKSLPLILVQGRGKIALISEETSPFPLLGIHCISKGPEEKKVEMGLWFVFPTKLHHLFMRNQPLELAGLTKGNNLHHTKGWARIICMLGNFPRDSIVPQDPLLWDMFK